MIFRLVAIDTSLFSCVPSMVLILLVQLLQFSRIGKRELNTHKHCLQKWIRVTTPSGRTLRRLCVAASEKISGTIQMWQRRRGSCCPCMSVSWPSTPTR